MGTASDWLDDPTVTPTTQANRLLSPWRSAMRIGLCYINFLAPNP
jgi:hypothetical protein